MPEPVVIIGPAARPAGPAGESAEHVVEADAADAGVQLQKSPKSDHRAGFPLLPALVRIASGVSALTARAFWTVAKGGLHLASRYPRHSLAAGASILILGAVLYTQLRSGKTARSPVTARIPGDAAPPVGESGTNPALAKRNEDNKDVATDKSGRRAVGKDLGKSNPPGDTTASSDAATPSEKSTTAPAPVAAALDDTPTPLPGVAEAPSRGQEPEPAPGKVASTGELAALPRAEPPATPTSEHDQASATLLTQTPPQPAPLPASSTVKDNLGNGDAVGLAAAPAPATTADLSPPSIHSFEPASIPAPTGDPLKLAATLEPVGDPKQSSPASAPDLVRPEPATGVPSSPNAADPPDRKAEDDEKKAQPTVAPDSYVDRKSTPTQNSVATTSNSESAKKEGVQPDSAQTKQEVEKTPTGIIGLAHTPEVAATVPLPNESTPPPNQPSSPAKPSVEGSAPLLRAAVRGAQSGVTHSATAGPVALSPGAQPDSRLETRDANNQVSDNRSQATDSNPTRTGDSREPDMRSPQSTLEGTEGVPPKPTGPAPAAKAKPSALEELTSTGWVSVPNSGKLVVEGDADSPRGNPANGNPAESFPSRDVRAHAAKDVSFEQVSPQSQTAQDAPRSGRGSSAGNSPVAETRSAPTAERVESVPHVVERNENFWTISRLYYSSGRYYRALWKANADKYPEINKLRVNDVIMIPPVEDLDPAYIDSPRTIAPASLAGATRASNVSSRGDTADLAESTVASSSINRDETVSTTRTNRGSAEGVPVRRSSRTDPDLDLPAAEAVTRQDRSTDRLGHRTNMAQGDDNDNSNEPETKTAARPRASGSAASRRPVYKVRQYDTLRSIARDMLGDSRRASEILDLNRDLIDDPTHLIVGQVLELPEDARTTLRRSASR